MLRENYFGRAIAPRSHYFPVWMFWQALPRSFLQHEQTVRSKKKRYFRMV
jgi:hypothetical protein